MNILYGLFYLIIFPGLLFTGNVGLLFSWISRRLTARLQWRVGPPFYQPWADVLKLFSKEAIIPKSVNRPAFISAPLLTICATLVTPILLANILTSQSWFSNVITLIYLLILPPLAAMLGGQASGNPLSSQGAFREAVLFFSYEIPFTISLLALTVRTGSLDLEKIVKWQILNKPLIFTIPGLIAFIVIFITMQAKLAIAPFEIPEAKTEIVAGPYTEYSGPLLALFKLSHAMLLFIYPWLISTLFFGGITLNASNPIQLVIDVIFSAVKIVAILIVMTFIGSINPRARIDQASRFLALFLTALAIAGLTIAYIPYIP